MRENKSRAYIPSAICNNETQYIKAQIARLPCNDISSSNNAASKTIIILGNSLLCSANTTQNNTQQINVNNTNQTSELNEIIEPEKQGEVLYSASIPAVFDFVNMSMTNKEILEKKAINFNFTIENKRPAATSFEVWSYVYNGTECYSCTGGDEKANRRVISIEANSSKTIELANNLNVTNDGLYKMKVKILETGASAPEEFDYDVSIKGANATQKSLFSIILIYALIAILGIALILGIAFVILNREYFLGLFREKTMLYKKKKEWKEKIEERRGAGILDRLEKGFLKSSKQLKEGQ